MLRRRLECLASLLAITVGCGNSEGTAETANALGADDAKQLRCGARFELFDFPGGVNTQILGINAQGTIVGRFDDADGVTQGFLRSHDGRLQIITVPGSGFTSAMMPCFNSALG